ncbi:hypothetical protein KDAU_49410 [Dictyobacter aurantiacus]|uniref:Uncharacterized protein n=1 Tax=Dictyobacter aurantiacus TaxID=1936993 RepID=A0A401ZLB1_9CHLR|nr:hypothetical protein KDAU_49410 [Dictyobacter aurantiacus]
MPAQTEYVPSYPLYTYVYLCKDDVMPTVSHMTLCAVPSPDGLSSQSVRDTLPKTISPTS